MTKGKGSITLEESLARLVKTGTWSGRKRWNLRCTRTI